LTIKTVAELIEFIELIESEDSSESNDLSKDARTTLHAWFPSAMLRVNSQLTTNGAGWIAPNMRLPWLVEYGLPIQELAHRGAA